MGKRLIPICIVLLFAIISGFPLLTKGLYPTHDGEYHVIRFYEFYKSIQEGVLYPRWAPDLNNGYGVPLFNYVYPLPNYVSSFLHFLGISFINAFKYKMFICGIIGALFFYLWTKRYWGTLGGIVSSVFYTFSPYHFLDVYIRGSVGEVWSLALFPAFFFLYDAYVDTRNNRYFILTCFALSLIIFSHNILALVFFPFVICYMIVKSINSFKKNIIPNMFILVFSIGLSSIFWMPALFEIKYVTGLQIYDIKSQFPELYELLIPSWGTGYLSTDPGNKMSFQIGIGNIIAVLLSIITLFLLKKNNNALIIKFFLLLFLIIFLLMLKLSFPIWEKIPLLQYVQFPWRLLSLEIFIASFLSGSIFLIKNSRILGILMVSLVVVLGINYTRPAYYHQRDDTYYTSRSNFIDGTNSPGNIFNTMWFNTSLSKKKNKIEGRNISIHDQTLKSNNYVFKYSAVINTHATINTAFFPGWSAYIDKINIKTQKTNDGLILVTIPKGKHVIKVFLNDTITQRFASLITLVSMIVLCSLFVIQRSAKIKK